MQQLEPSKQIVEEQKYKRECKGRSLALTRNVYHLVNSDVFYVQSESSNDIYYFVKFKPDIIEWCSCPDNSLRDRQMKCKHLHAIEFALKSGTLRDIDKIPSLLTTTSINNELNLPNNNKTIKIVSLPSISNSSSYKDDDYSF